MSKRILFAATILALLLASLSIAPANAGGSTRQIVFIMGESWLKFTSVSISGYNQNNQWVTWNKKDENGIGLAYTKNWWWSENFVQISFTVRDDAGNRSQKTCLIDTLAQPANSPRVEIVYYDRKGCVGGEAGSVRDPVKDSVKPIRNAFATVWYYLPDDKFDFFMTLLSYERDAIGCVLGVSAFIPGSPTAVLSMPVAFTPDVVQKSCPKTWDRTYKLFTTR